jgi:hypothetical protein
VAANVSMLTDGSKPHPRPPLAARSLRRRPQALRFSTETHEHVCGEIG